MSSNCTHATTRASGVCQQCAVEQEYEHLADELASEGVWDSEDDRDE